MEAHDLLSTDVLAATLVRELPSDWRATGTGSRRTLLWAPGVERRDVFVANVVATLAEDASQRARADELPPDADLVLAVTLGGSAEDELEERLTTTAIGSTQLLQITRWYREPDSGERSLQLVASAAVEQMAHDADLEAALRSLLDDVRVVARATDSGERE